MTTEKALAFTAQVECKASQRPPATTFSQYTTRCMVCFSSEFLSSYNTKAPGDRAGDPEPFKSKRKTPAVHVCLLAAATKWTVLLAY